MDISTHALTEGDGFFSNEEFIRYISTHALTEGDFPSFSVRHYSNYISTHALTEGDYFHNYQLVSKHLFQLTPSRRATDDVPEELNSIENFNSRPHGGRRNGQPENYGDCIISTHALTEGDALGTGIFRSDQFQLTPSRRATLDWRMPLTKANHFNSRPHGGRLQHLLNTGRCLVFQLTPSRRATRNINTLQLPIKNFNSRPHGGRQSPCC